MKHVVLFLTVVAWILIPTGTPDDILITIPLIKALGTQMYILLMMGLLVLLWYNKVTFKKMANEMKKQYKWIKKKVQKWL